MWDLLVIPKPGVEPGSPALGVQSFSHWTTREVPVLRKFKKKIIFCYTPNSCFFFLND